MTDRSNIFGRAYEYACINALYRAIKRYRRVTISENSCFQNAHETWSSLSLADRLILSRSAGAYIDTLFALEPMILDDNNDEVLLYIQADSRGEDGDVRDIVIDRATVDWEIGLSVKHNNFAVKHSRIASSLDFGEKWYGIPCSADYWKTVNPIFRFLAQENAKGTLFSDLKSKASNIYMPLLNAVMAEIHSQVKKDKNVPRRLVEYILSRYDFYKVISIDRKRITTLQSFNIYGTLNKGSHTQPPKIIVPRLKLPTSILHIGMKPNSHTTMLMVFDNGWQFSFRIHNGDKKVVPSLKFDVQIVGMPTEINQFIIVSGKAKTAFFKKRNCKRSFFYVKE